MGSQELYIIFKVLQGIVAIKWGDVSQRNIADGVVEQYQRVSTAELQEHVERDNLSGKVRCSREHSRQQLDLLPPSQAGARTALFSRLPIPGTIIKTVRGVSSGR